jgi:uncharacterized membrane protein YdjX (TVP38/TMEM64 family)
MIERDTPLLVEYEIEQLDGERPRAVIFVLGICIVAAIVLLWLATPLREWIDVARIVALLRRFGDSPLAPLLMMAGYVAGGLVVFPVNVLIAVTVIVFGPLLGLVYSLAGCLLSGAVLYEIGRALPANALRGRTGSRVQKVGVRLGGFGVASMASVRIVPLAPFSVVSLVAGITHVRRRAYLLGTVLGMLPGIAVNTFFIDRILAAIHAPGPVTLVLAAFAAAAIVTLVLIVRHRLGRSAVGE